MGNGNARKKSDKDFEFLTNQFGTEEFKTWQEAVNGTPVLSALSERLGIALCFRAKKVAVEASLLPADEKEQAVLLRKLEGTVENLRKAVEKERKKGKKGKILIKAEEFDAAETRARNEIPEEAELMETVSFTSARLRIEELAKLVGQEETHLRQIEKLVKSPYLFIQDSIVVAEKRQFEGMCAKDPGLDLRIRAVFAALENLVLQGGAPTEKTVVQTIKKAIQVQNIALGGVAEVTKDGHQIDKEDVFLSELEGSSLFVPYIVKETCAADETFSPAEKLLVLDGQRKILKTMAQGKEKHFRRIAKAVGDGVLISAKEDAIILRGLPEAVAAARAYLIDFGHRLFDTGLNDQAAVSHILSVVLGEVSESSLSLIEDRKGKKNGKKTSEITVQDIRGLKLNFYTSYTSNQRRYLELVSAKDVQFVICQGPAGTGKTSILLQAAMRQICEHYAGVPGADFQRLVITKPLQTVGGKDIGALPGGINEKTAPWYASYHDHLTQILAPKAENGERDLQKGRQILANLTGAGIIRVENIEFLRGKSIPNAIVVLDEAQNTSTEAMRTFLTRPDRTSRVIVIGDLEQMDARGEPNYRALQPYKIPRSVRLDKEGRVYVSPVGDQERFLGFHKNCGEFRVRVGETAASVTPRNGFFLTALLLSSSPHAKFAILDHTDMQRLDGGRDFLLLEEALRVPVATDAAQLPVGCGEIDAIALLRKANRPAKENLDRGNVVAINAPR